MFKTVTSLFLAAVAIAAFGVTDANATTFCVPSFHAACPNNGTNVAQANLETAMQSNSNDGAPDTIKIDGVELSDAQTWEPSGTDVLTIEGAGAATRLTSASTINSYTINLANGGNSRSVTMRNLTVVIPASIVGNGGAAVQISDDTLENVDIESLNPGGAPLPSWLVGGTYTGGRIYSAGAGTIHNAVRTDGNATGTVNIVDAEIEPVTGSAISVTGPGTVNVRRSHIDGSAQTAISASSGTTNVENTLIESAPTTMALYAFANSADNVTINADHLTMVSGGGNAAAVGAQVGASTGNASLTLTNSIQRGYLAAYLRSAQAASANGNANVTIAYSNFHLTGSEVSTGDGTLTAATGNIDADPQFVSATNFQLKSGSPSIDAGNPGAGLTEDLLGAPRPFDGDLVAGAIRDQGAYENQTSADPPADPADPADPNDPADPADPSDPADPTDPGDPTNPELPNAGDTTAPDTVKGKGPKAKLRKKKATFAFTSEAGATFSCALDGKALATCTSPLNLKRLKRGKHVLTVAAVDSAGNADPTPATWKFRVVKKRRGGH